jgi:hypothetical protein
LALGFLPSSLVCNFSNTLFFANENDKSFALFKKKGIRSY